MVVTWLLNIWRHFYGRFNKYGFHFVVRLFKINHRWLQNVVKTKIKVAHDIMISSFVMRMNFTWQWRHNCFRSKLLSTRCEMSNARSPPCARKYALKGKNLFISTSVMPSFLAKFTPPWETFVSVMQRIKECNWEGAEGVGPITFRTHSGRSSFAKVIGYIDWRPFVMNWLQGISFS